MTTREGDRGGSGRAQEPGLAPVTYLPGVARVDEEPVRWAVPLERPQAQDDAAGPSADDDEHDGSDEAEEVLARRLRRSALSEREARTFLAQRGIDSAAVEDTIERFTSRGWI